MGWKQVHRATTRFLAMEAVGLLRRADTLATSAALVAMRSPFHHMRKSLRLWVEGQGNAGDDDDMAYVYAGYAPLLPRLIERAEQDSWARAHPLVPGPHFERVAVGEAETAAAAARGGRELTVLVVILGGITYSEISALRFAGAASDAAPAGTTSRFAAVDR